jgi:hypothetical protein
MAYELHIVRTKDWLEASTAPITKSDVDALIARDPELGWSTTDYADMSDETRAVMRYWMITWRGQSCFWWYRDQIYCSGPDEAQRAKLVQMARALDAYAVGDDGEVYLSATEVQKKEAEPPTPAERPPRPPPAFFRWPLWKQLVAAFLLGCVLLALKLLIFRG